MRGRADHKMAGARRRLPVLELAAAVLLVVGLAVSASPQASDSLQLIVHPGVAGGKIPKAVVAQIFLRQVPKWGDGSPIEPVDHSLTSQVRLEFVRDVLGMTALEIHQYWSGAMSTGTLPPPVKESDKEIIGFVASHPGAIGYVAADTSVPGTVKILQIE